MSAPGDDLKDRGYVVEKTLGSGAFGSAYLVRNDKNEPYAVKTIHGDETTMKLAASEVDMLSKIPPHPHILKYIEHWEHNGTVFLVTEACLQSTLKELLRSAAWKDMKEPEIVDFMIHMADALAHLHNNNIIHRDLKPENIFYSVRSLLLGDFGLATSERATRAHQTHAGTLCYMSPQSMAHEKYTSKTDVWSLGCIFYEMLVGKVPFDKVGKQSFDATRKDMKKHRYLQVDEKYSAALRDLIDDMLSYAENDRPDMLAVLQTLQNLRNPENAEADVQERKLVSDLLSNCTSSEEKEQLMSLKKLKLFFRKGDDSVLLLCKMGVFGKLTSALISNMDSEDNAIRNAILACIETALRSTGIVGKRVRSGLQESKFLLTVDDIPAFEATPSLQQSLGRIKVAMKSYRADETKPASAGLGGVAPMAIVEEDEGDEVEGSAHTTTGPIDATANDAGTSEGGHAAASSSANDASGGPIVPSGNSGAAPPLARKESIPASEHDLKNLFDTAQIEFRRGNFLDAYKQHQKCLKARLKLLGSQHRDVWASQYAVGSCQLKLEDSEAAISTFKSLLSAENVQQAGDDWEIFTDSHLMLGRHLMDEGESEDAMAHFKDASALFLSRGRSADDIEVLECNVALAKACAQAGQFEKAEELLNPMLSGPTLLEHEDLAKSANQVAAIVKTEQLGRAEAFYQSGSELFLRGDYKAAFNGFQKARRLQKQYLGADHPDTLRSLHFYGSSLLRALDQDNDGQLGSHHLENGLNALTRCFERRLHVLGESDPDTMETLCVLGSSVGYGSVPRVQGGDTSWMPRVGTVLKMSDVPTVSRDRLGALFLLQLCLDMRFERIGPESSETKATDDEMERLLAHEDMSDFSSKLVLGTTIDELRKSVDHFQACYGPRHPKTQRVRVQLIELCTSEKRSGEAVETASALLEHHLAILGGMHAETVYAAWLLAKTTVYRTPHDNDLAMQRLQHYEEMHSYGDVDGGDATLRELAYLRVVVKHRMHSTDIKELVTDVDDVIKKYEDEEEPYHEICLNARVLRGRIMADMDSTLTTSVTRVSSYLLECSVLCRRYLGEKHATTRQALLELCCLHTHAGNHALGARFLRNAMSIDGSDKSKKDDPRVSSCLEVIFESCLSQARSALQMCDAYECVQLLSPLLDLFPSTTVTLLSLQVRQMLSDAFVQLGDIHAASECLCYPVADVERFERHPIETFQSLTYALRFQNLQILLSRSSELTTVYTRLLNSAEATFGVGPMSSIISVRAWFLRWLNLKHDLGYYKDGRTLSDSCTFFFKNAAKMEGFDILLKEAKNLRDPQSQREDITKPAPSSARALPPEYTRASIRLSAEANAFLQVALAYGSMKEVFVEILSGTSAPNLEHTAKSIVSTYNEALSLFKATWKSENWIFEDITNWIALCHLALEHQFDYEIARVFRSLINRTCDMSSSYSALDASHVRRGEVFSDSPLELAKSLREKAIMFWLCGDLPSACDHANRALQDCVSYRDRVLRAGLSDDTCATLFIRCINISSDVKKLKLLLFESVSLCRILLIYFTAEHAHLLARWESKTKHPGAANDSQSATPAHDTYSVNLDAPERCVCRAACGRLLDCWCSRGGKSQDTGAWEIAATQLSEILSEVSAKIGLRSSLSHLCALLLSKCLRMAGRVGDAQSLLQDYVEMPTNHEVQVFSAYAPLEVLYCLRVHAYPQDSAAEFVSKAVPVLGRTMKAFDPMSVLTSAASGSSTNNPHSSNASAETLSLSLFEEAAVVAARGWMVCEFAENLTRLGNIDRALRSLLPTMKRDMERTVAQAKSSGRFGHPHAAGTTGVGLDATKKCAVEYLSLMAEEQQTLAEFAAAMIVRPHFKSTAAALSPPSSDDTAPPQPAMLLNFDGCYYLAHRYLPKHHPLRVQIANQYAAQILQQPMQEELALAVLRDAGGTDPTPNKIDPEAVSSGGGPSLFAALAFTVWDRRLPVRNLDKEVAGETAGSEGAGCQGAVGDVSINQTAGLCEASVDNTKPSEVKTADTASPGEHGPSTVDATDVASALPPEACNDVAELKPEASSSVDPASCSHGGSSVDAAVFTEAERMPESKSSASTDTPAHETSQPEGSNKSVRPSGGDVSDSAGKVLTVKEVEAMLASSIRDTVQKAVEASQKEDFASGIKLYHFAAARHLATGDVNIFARCLFRALRCRRAAAMIMNRRGHHSKALSLLALYTFLCDEMRCCARDFPTDDSVFYQKVSTERSQLLRGLCYVLLRTERYNDLVCLYNSMESSMRESINDLYIIARQRTELDSLFKYLAYISNRLKLGIFFGDNVSASSGYTRVALFRNLKLAELAVSCYEAHKENRVLSNSCVKFSLKCHLSYITYLRSNLSTIKGYIQSSKDRPPALTDLYSHSLPPVNEILHVLNQLLLSIRRLWRGESFTDITSQLDSLTQDVKAYQRTVEGYSGQVHLFENLIRSLPPVPNLDTPASELVEAHLSKPSTNPNFAKVPDAPPSKLFGEITEAVRQVPELWAARQYLGEAKIDGSKDTGVVRDASVGSPYSKSKSRISGASDAHFMSVKDCDKLLERIAEVKAEVEKLSTDAKCAAALTSFYSTRCTCSSRYYCDCFKRSLWVTLCNKWKHPIKEPTPVQLHIKFCLAISQPMVSGEVAQELLEHVGVIPKYSSRWTDWNTDLPNFNSSGQLRYDFTRADVNELVNVFFLRMLHSWNPDGGKCQIFRRLVESYMKCPMGPQTQNWMTKRTRILLYSRIVGTDCSYLHDLAPHCLNYRSLRNLEADRMERISFGEPGYEQAVVFGLAFKVLSLYSYDFTSDLPETLRLCLGESHVFTKITARCLPDNSSYSQSRSITADDRRAALRHIALSRDMYDNEMPEGLRAFDSMKSTVASIHKSYPETMDTRIPYFSNEVSGEVIKYMQNLALDETKGAEERLGHALKALTHEFMINCCYQYSHLEGPVRSLVKELYGDETEASAAKAFETLKNPPSVPVSAPNPRAPNPRVAQDPKACVVM
eukprot:Rmarinus@m.15158